MLTRLCSKPHCKSSGDDRLNASIPFSSCAACLGVSYCGSTCQAADWNRHGAAECEQMKQISLMVRQCTPKESLTTTNSVQVIDDSKSNFGRVVVAKRDFVVGDSVFHEDPLLVWLDNDNKKKNNNNNIINNNNQHSPEGILMAFSNASPDKRAKVLDLYHPALSSITGPSAIDRNELQALCERLGLDLSLDTAQRLLLIDQCNTHGFSGADRQLDVHATTVSASALFSIGAKVEHSCMPNVTMDSSSGHLVYTAIRPIGVGERITFAYTSTKQDTQTRQRKLQSSKLFWCSCARCVVPDASRPLVCIRAGCPGFALRKPASSPAEDESGSWECLKCNHVALDEEVVQFEQRVLTNYQDVEHLRLDKQRPVGLAIRRAYEVQQLATQLPPMHYVHGLCHTLVLRSAISEAVLIDQSSSQVRESLFPSTEDCTEHVQKLRKKSMSEALELLVWREKVEAVVDGRKMSRGWPSTTNKTPDVALSIDDVLEQVLETLSDPLLKPSMTSVSDAFDAGIELMNANTPSTEAAAAQVFRRYEVEIFSWLPADDPNRRRIRDLLAIPIDSTSTATKASVASTGYSFSRLIGCML